MIFMLRLKNIKIENGIAEADYYPEGGEVHGHIVVDVESWEYIQGDAVPGFGTSYLGPARRHLIRMAKNGETDKQRLVMWY